MVAIDQTKFVGNIERQQGRIAGVIKATGGAANISQKEVERWSRSLAAATLNSTQGYREAAAVLLTFKNISGEAFKETLSLSGDLAEIWGGDLRSKATQLGKAIEDPIAGLSSLNRVGVTFSEGQKERIKGYQEEGQLLKAQGVLLEVLNKQLGGVADEAGKNVLGAFDLLDQRLEETRLAFGKIELVGYVVESLAKKFGVLAEVVRSPEQNAALLETNELIQKRNDILSGTKPLETYLRGTGGVIGILQYISSLGQLGALEKELQEQNQKAALDASTTRTNELANISSITSGKIELITTQKGYLQSIKDVTDVINEQIQKEKELEQSKLDVLRTSINVVNQIKKAEADAIKELATIRENAKSSQLSDEYAIIELKRRGLSESRKQSSIEREIAAKIREARKLLADGEIDLARAAADRAKSLSGQLKDNRKAVRSYQEAAKVTKDSYKTQTEAAQKNVTDTAKAKKEAIRILDEQKDSVVQLTEELERLASKEYKTKVKIDTSEALKKLQELKAKMDSLNVTTTAGGNPVQGFAEGGAVPGTGSGDTVRAMLTPGEYVLTTSDVKQMGGFGGIDALRRSLNTYRPNPIQIPSAPRRFATGGGVSNQGSGETFVINLGGQQISATSNSSQSQTRAFMNELKRSQRAR